MKIPLKVKLGGHTFLINQGQKVFEEYFKGDDDEHRKAGITYLGGNLILIDRTNARQQQEESFLHEIIHQIFFRMGRNKECEDEQLVQGLASWLYSFLKDNKLLK